MSSALSYVEEVVPIEKLKEDEEFRNLVPSNNSRDDLEKSLREKSQIFPLITDKNYVLIDGYTRLSIMKKLQFKEVRILRYDFDSQQERDKAYELIWVFNGVRRQLDKNEKVALFQKIADRIAKVRVSKNKTEESKIESHATQFYKTESKQIEENEEFVELEDGTKIPASEYERILKELDKENKALSRSDKHKMAILRINAPWLLKYVTDQKYKVPLDQAFRIYTTAKDLGILDKLKDLAPALRDPLISTREGRKIILNDEYRDLLEKILNREYTTERAISEVKQREASKRGEKKPEVKEEAEKREEIKTIEETETKREAEVSSKPEEELGGLPVILRKLVNENKLGLEEARSLNTTFSSQIHLLQRAYDEGKLTDDDVLTLLTTPEGKEILSNYNGKYASLFMNIITGNEKVNDAISEVRKSKEAEKKQEVATQPHYVEVPIDAVIIRIRRNKAIAVPKNVLLDIMSGNIDKYPDIKELFNKQGLIEDGDILWGNLSIMPTEEISGNGVKGPLQLSIDEIKKNITNGYGFIRVNKGWYAVRSDWLYKFYYAKQLSNDRKDLKEKVNRFKIQGLYDLLEDALIV